MPVDLKLTSLEVIRFATKTRLGRLQFAGIVEIDDQAVGVDVAAEKVSHARIGMISDAVTNVYISSSRGSSDQTRARQLKEGIAQIKQAIEIGIAQTKDKHAVHREKPAPGASQAES